MCKFYIKTLGCKVNQFESECIIKKLVDYGWYNSVLNGNATVCIINTCAVTAKASMDSRNAIRNAIKKNPDAKIIVTGCYAQTEAKELSKIKGVDEIIGHAEKHKIPDILLNHDQKFQFKKINNEKKCKSTIFSKIIVNSEVKRTRPFLKIQDGCNSFCTYCIIPYSRGQSRSMTVSDIVDNLKIYKKAGFREVVLTGIHVGHYGLDLSPSLNLFDLLQKIEKLKIIDKIRLSSIEPCEVTSDIINLVANSDIFCNHFHIPLQSGDNIILKKMNRPYDSDLFKEVINNIKEKIPDASIGVDILVGFPDESEKAFENTYMLIDKLPVNYLHVFPFSPRKGVPANNFKKKIPMTIIKQRCKRMRNLGFIKSFKFSKNFIGHKIIVLVEKKSNIKSGFLKGISSNYMTIHFTGKDYLKNTFVKLKIEKVKNDNTIWGKIVKK